MKQYAWQWSFFITAQKIVSGVYFLIAANSMIHLLNVDAFIGQLVRSVVLVVYCSILQK